MLSEARSITGEPNTNTADNIIPFPEKPTFTAATEQTFKNYRKSFLTTGYGIIDEESEFKNVKPQGPRKSTNITIDTSVIKNESKTILQDAFYCIVDSLDDDLERAQKSNCFDEWKEKLELISFQESNFSGKHRKILGSILSATKNRDIADFNQETLIIFKDATNSLRHPKLTQKESKSIVKSIIKAGCSVIMPLSADLIDETKEKELSEMFSVLLKKSNNHK